MCETVPGHAGGEEVFVQRKTRVNSDWYLGSDTTASCMLAEPPCSATNSDRTLDALPRFGLQPCTSGLTE